MTEDEAKEPQVDDDLFLVTRGSYSTDPLLVMRRAKVAKVTPAYVYLKAHPETSPKDLAFFPPFGLTRARLHRARQARFLAFDPVTAVKRYLEFCDERVGYFAGRMSDALNAQTQFLQQRDAARVMLHSLDR